MKIDEISFNQSSISFHEIDGFWGAQKTISLFQRRGAGIMRGHFNRLVGLLQASLFCHDGVITELLEGSKP